MADHEISVHLIIDASAGVGSKERPSADAPLPAQYDVGPTGSIVVRDVAFTAMPSLEASDG